MKAEHERFFSHVVWGPSGCLLWTAYIRSSGYGQFRSQAGSGLAHRWAFEWARGPIPAGYEIDHLCRVKHCVNPAHLEAVTPRENNMRSDSRAALNARRTQCIHGHPLSGTNVRVYDGMRKCMTCQKERNSRRRRGKSQ